MSQISFFLTPTTSNMLHCKRGGGEQPNICKYWTLNTGRHRHKQTSFLLITPFL